MIKSRSTRETLKLFKGIAQLLKPPPKMQISDWANAFVQLSSEDSAEPGRYSTERAPYQKEMMDAVSMPEVETVVYMTGAQIGKTQLLKNILGYYIDYQPSPILFMQPTLLAAKDFSKERIAPFIRDCKVLSDKVSEAKSRDSGNSILQKTFPGGYLALVGANSPAGLASRPIRILLADEIDRFGASAGTEGDPLSLAQKRTTTFYNRKKIFASTPGDAGVSRIEVEYLSGTQEEWNLKCPVCGDYSAPEWDRFIADEENDVYSMVCPHCGAISTDLQWKRLNMKDGKWIAKAPENLIANRKRSFHMNSFSSPWTPWKEIQAKYRAAEKLGENGIKTFFNTEMGIPYEEVRDETKAEDLMKRREDYGAELPDKVLVLTCAVDTQDDRLEVEVVGWGMGMENFGIQYYRIYGDPDQDKVWNQLDDIILKTTWTYKDGTRRGISLTCIDSGGHKTEAVYKYCSKRFYNRVFPIKGVSGFDKPIIVGRPTKIPHFKHVNLFKVGVDTGKDTIYGDLNAPLDGPRSCHFPLDPAKGYDEQYFEGLLSEYKTEKVANGRIEYCYKLRPGHKRNEPLDIRNYNYAAFSILNPNLQVIAETEVKDFTPYKPPEQSEAPRIRRRRKIGKGVSL